MGDSTRPVVFFFDCDNTLLDNDRVHDDLNAYLEQSLGRENCARYWASYEKLRQELGYADYLGAVQGLRLGAENDMRALELSTFLLEYPFASRLYPGALDAIAHCDRQGLTVILSDGDAVFQPRKLRRAGLWDAVDGRVLIYIHKERMLDDALQRYPARHYFMIDDKLRILASMKAIMGESLTTIWPRQGHYALDVAANAGYPGADVTVERIGELVQYNFSESSCPQK
jgi:FMN phosphatase YigB (HAD superfamily)